MRGMRRETIEENEIKKEEDKRGREGRRKEREKGGNRVGCVLV